MITTFCLSEWRKGSRLTSLKARVGPRIWPGWPSGSGSIATEGRSSGSEIPLRKLLGSSMTSASRVGASGTG